MAHLTPDKLLKYSERRNLLFILCNVTKSSHAPASSWILLFPTQFSPKQTKNQQQPKDALLWNDRNLLKGHWQ